MFIEITTHIWYYTYNNVKLHFYGYCPLYL